MTKHNTDDLENEGPFTNRVGKSSARRIVQRAMRLLPVFLELREYLTVAILTKVSPELAYLWRKLLVHYKKFSALPSQAVLLSYVADDFEDEFSAEDFAFDAETVKTTIRTAFTAVFDEHAEIDWTLATARRLLQEQAMLASSQFVQSGQIPNQALQLFDELSANVHRYDAIGRALDDEFIPAEWEPEGAALRPTNLQFIDDYMGGGPAEGEVIGVIGPIGVCKTTLGVQITTQGVRSEPRRARSQNYDGKRRLFFLFAYETASDNEFRVRTLSSIAEISKTRLEKGTKVLSTSKSLAPYEQELYRTKIAAGEPVKGERERMAHWAKILNKYMVFGDMTGHDPRQPGRGTGGIAEIVAIVEATLRKNPDAVVGSIVIDYVDLLVSRKMAADNRRSEEKRFMIEATVRDAKKLLARRYQAPVWLLQQLSGKANERAGGTVSQSSEAKECKSFHENVDFSLAVGLPTNDHLLTLNWDKVRRVEKQSPVVVRVRGDLQRLESTHDQYCIDLQSRRIVSRSEMQQIGEFIPTVTGYGNTAPQV